IFGVNARAELILFLLAEGEGNSNQIARETHYDQKNVYVLLERWAGAGFIDRKKRGKQNLYSLKPGSKAFLPAEIGNKFWSWEPFFLSFGRLFVAVHSEPWRNDAYLLSSLFRSIHHDLLTLAKAAGIVLPDPQLLPGEDLFAAMAGALARIPDSF
ncbi:MAG: helix-turn-helix domain-containing protein, partial [Acidobacteria bacterium]|nr:helix-turn-helix domain-containing protein [Acidobacteriota bacterium]